LYVKDVVNRDSTIQSDVRRFWLQVKRIQVPCQPSGRSSHPVRTPICQPFQPSGRLPYRPDPLYCIKKLLYQLTYVRTSQQPVRTTFSDRPAVIDQLQILSKFRIREYRYPSGRCWCPVQMRVSIRQELQFKYHGPDVSQPWSGLACN